MWKLFTTSSTFIQVCFLWHNHYVMGPQALGFWRSKAQNLANPSKLLKLKIQDLNIWIFLNNVCSSQLSLGQCMYITRTTRFGERTRIHIERQMKEISSYFKSSPDIYEVRRVNDSYFTWLLWRFNEAIHVIPVAVSDNKEFKYSSPFCHCHLLLFPINAEVSSMLREHIKTS